MGRYYTQLTLEDRCEMARLHTTGRYSPANHRGNSGSRAIDGGSRAEPQWVHHPGLPRLCRPTSPGAPLAGLQARPRQHAPRHGPGAAPTRLVPPTGGRPPRREQHRPVISHETIYRFIYAQMARKTEYAWRHYLPQAKAKRGRRCYKGRSPASFIALRRPLAERPAAVADRCTPGHWEADLMLFRIYGQAILTLHERHSRLLIAARPPGKAAAPIAHAIATLLAPLPPTWRQTITFDNGTEFARHYALHTLGLETFFCETHSPWQKGGVENAIGRLRRTLPRKTDLATLSDEHFTRLVQVYNNTPRKCLGYQTPAEVFRNHVALQM